jgi:hypothetical protein
LAWDQAIAGATPAALTSFQIQNIECRVQNDWRHNDFPKHSAFFILNSAFQQAAVAEYIRHPSSKRIYAGGTPAGSAKLTIARWRQSSPDLESGLSRSVLVRVQHWQPISGCIVSSRRPRLERGGRECNSLHPDHFGWLAEQ